MNLSVRLTDAKEPRRAVARPSLQPGLTTRPVLRQRASAAWPAWPRKAAMVSHSKPVDMADKRSGPPGAAVRWVPAVMAVGAVIVLAACGSVAAGGAGHPASAGAGHAT